MHCSMLQSHSGYMFGQIDDPQSGEFIAAANPQMVMKLITRIRALEAAEEWLTNGNNDQNN